MKLLQLNKNGRRDPGPFRTFEKAMFRALIFNMIAPGEGRRHHWGPVLRLKWIRFL